MTIPLLHLGVLLLGTWSLAFVCGRRSYRKKLQTSDGRWRAGAERPRVLVEPCTDFVPVVDPPTTILRLPTSPQPTVVLPRQR